MAAIEGVEGYAVAEDDDTCVVVAQVGDDRTAEWLELDGVELLVVKDRSDLSFAVLSHGLGHYPRHWGMAVCWTFSRQCGDDDVVP
jgi:hypothetical protein